MNKVLKMKLRAKIINITVGGAFVVVLNKADSIALDVLPLERVSVSSKSKKAVAVVDLAASNLELEPGEVGVFLDLAKEVNVYPGELLDIKYEPKPTSLVFIKKKLDKQALNEKEINAVISDVVANRLTDIEIACFVSACYSNGMTLDESAYLTKAIVNNGARLQFNFKPIVDKHCIGGIPGNRTTLVIVPILAAAGLKVPKTSTRSITSPAGTSDTMEVLAPVTFSKEKIIDIVKHVGACMVWGGTQDLASADDKLIKIEKPLNLDPEGILLASILAKKSSANSTHVLIDIPVGREAKIEDPKKAKKLAKKFEILGKKIGLKIKAIITAGSQPIGDGIGPALEARDCLLVLQNLGPKDLRDKSIDMSVMIMEMIGIKNAKNKVLEILESGAAEKKMREIIKAQGGNSNIQPGQIKIGPFKEELFAKKSGKVAHISNKIMARLAKTAGAPTSKGAGIDLKVRVNTKVDKGDLLYIIYAENKDKLSNAIEILKDENPIAIK